MTRPSGSSQVQKICQPAHAPVGQQCSRVRVEAQRRRSCDRPAIDDAGAGDIKAHQHLVEQRMVAAGPRHVECFQKLVVADPDRIQREPAVKRRALAANIGDVQDDVVGQLALN